MVLASACTGAASPTVSTPSPTSNATPIPTASGGTPAPSATQGLQPLPAAEQTTVRVAEAGEDPPSFTMQYASKKGLFAKYGLDVKVTRVSGGVALLTQAILSGQVEVASTNMSPVILSLTTDVPLVQVGVATNKLPDYLYGGKGVTGADQLRGQRVGISQLGGQSHAEVVLGLQAVGLKPSDVTIIQIGGESARMAALQAGTIKAAPAGPELAEKLTSEGFTILVKLPEAKEVFAGTGIQFRRDYVKQNPNTVLRFVAACLEATQLEVANPNDVAQYYADWLQIPLADAQKTWQDFTQSGIQQRDLRTTDAAIEPARAILAAVNPEVANVDITPAWDGSFLDKLEAMGYFEELGVPTP